LNFLKISCINSTETINLNVYFPDFNLGPNDETRAILIMSKSFTNIAEINGIPNRKFKFFKFKIESMN
jgi:hypothetical protein